MSFKRGITNHSKLFIDDLDADTLKQKYIGRNKGLIDKRNLALFHRYYFIASQTKNSYEIIIKRLSGEFYISEITISKIVASNLDLVSQIKKEKPGIDKLKKLHPHFDWRIDNRYI